jgi:hypothetical protein
VIGSNKKLRLSTLLAVLVATVHCGPPKSIEAEEVLKNLEAHAGKRVVVRGKFKSGARCRQENEQWQTYCKDCQYCRGPVVLDSGANLVEEGLDDWPMILGGTFDNQDIRCKGPLNAVECYPFVEGKTYVIQGKIEAQRPPKLLVEKFWQVD